MFFLETSEHSRIWRGGGTIASRLSVNVERKVDVVRNSFIG
jgi:hypothetical protein